MIERIVQDQHDRPGLNIDGDDVANLDLSGQIDRIVEYNATDAVTAHLLMLRVALHGGHLTSQAYHEELEAVHSLVADQVAQGQSQFARFQEVWDSRQSGTAPPAVQGLTQIRLKRRWFEVAQIVREKCGIHVWAALDSRRGLEVVDEVVVVSFDGHGFACEKVRAAHRQTERIMRIIMEVLGAKGLWLVCQ